MKKFISLSIFLVFLLICNSAVEALNYYPHIIVGSLVKVSWRGGSNIILSDYAHIQETEYTEIKGLDRKERFRKLYSGEYKADFSNADEETKADLKYFLSLMGRTTLPESINPIQVTPYKEFNDKTWADMKFRELDQQEQGDKLVIIPVGSMSSKRIAKNTVPTAKTGLLNPKSPIIIETFINKITLNIPADDISHSYARLLDSKGNEAGRLTKSSSREITLESGSREAVSEIPIPWEGGTYYLEICYYDGISRTYCYILLNIKPESIRPAEDKSVSAGIERLKQMSAKGEKVTADYMKRNNIKSTKQLTDEDKQAISEEYTKTQTSGVQRTHALSQMQIISNYMKEHNIKSMAGLKDKDMKAISKLVMKNAILSWPPQQRAVADEYMKQHNISDYEDLTEKDLKAIGKLAKESVSKQKSSAKKRTSK